MKYKIILIVFTILLSACVSSKKYEEVEALQKATQASLKKSNDMLETATKEKDVALSNVAALEEQISFLKENYASLLNNVNGLTLLTQKGAENLQRSLESLKEKDKRIKSLQEAVTRRDSIAFALVSTLRSALNDFNDSDIEINVVKGVVYVSISDKLLFRSGSYIVSNRAKNILGKVAKVLKSRPEIEFMVEGHTDNVPINKDILKDIEDNWDLSVKRAVAVVRILQNNFKIAPERITAAGRSYYNSKKPNNSVVNRAKNRRTTIIILPKLDQFHNLVEEGMGQFETTNE